MRRGRCVSKALAPMCEWADDEAFARCPMHEDTEAFYAENANA